MGLHRAGFEVLGVDLHPQPEYPFEFRCADALVQDLDGYDLVWTSPPCQRWSQAQHRATDESKAERHPDLIGRVRRRLEAWGGLWVIENVLRSPLRNPARLCGAMFGLGVVRHRIFETSWNYEAPAHRKHQGSVVTGEYVTVAGNGGVPSWTMKERERRGLPRHIPGEMSLQRWQEAMGIGWLSRKALVQAIPPAYARHIGESAIRQLRRARASTTSR